MLCTKAAMAASIGVLGQTSLDFEVARSAGKIGEEEQLANREKSSSSLSLPIILYYYILYHLLAIIFLILVS